MILQMCSILIEMTSVITEPECNHVSRFLERWQGGGGGWRGGCGRDKSLNALLLFPFLSAPSPLPFGRSDTQVSYCVCNILYPSSYQAMDSIFVSCFHGWLCVSVLLLLLLLQDQVRLIPLLSFLTQ